jgi:hypothetical protein
VAAVAASAVVPLVVVASAVASAVAALVVVEVVEVGSHKKFAKTRIRKVVLTN